MDEHDLGSSLIGAIHDAEDLKDIAAQLGDLALDEFLDEGLAKNIPIVELLRKIHKATISYSDFLLTKKIVKFLAGLSSVPLDQRKKQIDRLAEDAEHRRRVGENLMLLLERLDDMGKPDLLSRAWRAYLEGKIDGPSLLRLNRAIDQFYFADIPLIRDVYSNTVSAAGLPRDPFGDTDRKLIFAPNSPVNEGDRLSEHDWHRLLQIGSSGLLDFVLPGGSPFGSNSGLRLNYLGRIFVEHVIDEIP